MTGAGVDFYERLLDVSRAAHGNGQHEVAYHALVAAMHAADDGADAARLREVEREAEAQIAWIDRHAPGHRLSTHSAGRHGHPGVYAMLARQAAGHVTVQAHRVEREARVDVAGARRDEDGSP